MNVSVDIGEFTLRYDPINQEWSIRTEVGMAHLIALILRKQFNHDKYDFAVYQYGILFPSGWSNSRKDMAERCYNELISIKIWWLWFKSTWKISQIIAH